MLQVEEAVVLAALVSESKVDARAVLRGCPDEIGHDPGDVEGQLALRPLRHLHVPARFYLGSTTGVDLFTAVLSVNLLGWGPLLHLPSLGFELLLPLGLQVRSLRQWLYDLPCVSHAAGHIHNGLVADDVGEAVHFPEELSLQPVDVLFLPEACTLDCLERERS